MDRTHRRSRPTEVRVECLEGRQLLSTTVVLKLYSANMSAGPVLVESAKLRDAARARIEQAALDSVKVPRTPKLPKDATPAQQEAWKTQMKTWQEMVEALRPMAPVSGKFALTDVHITSLNAGAGTTNAFDSAVLTLYEDGAKVERFLFRSVTETFDQPQAGSTIGLDGTTAHLTYRSIARMEV
jgi:hypothetical protein